jgi:heme-degrading monooxygenase HmoA
MAIEPGGTMIARIWHGVTNASQADEYLSFLIRRAIPDYESVEGNRGAYILRRMEGAQAHFLTLTFWDSAEAIQKFAGADIEQAKYYPEDARFLREFEPTVAHYQAYDAQPG